MIVDMRVAIVLAGAPQVQQIYKHRLHFEKQSDKLINRVIIYTEVESTCIFTVSNLFLRVY